MQILDRLHHPPAQPLPEGATDCHMHVFGPFSSFPLAAERAYSVDEAPLVAYEWMKRQAGLQRTVLVQASGYGNDNRAMLAALDHLGTRGRGVAVIDPDMPRPVLEKLHAAGVRAARLNLHSLGSRYAEDAATLIDRFARTLKPLGWHLQLFLDAEGIARVEQSIARAGIVVVLDHMGLPDGARGIEQPGFQAVLRLLSTGHVWAKLSGADRITRQSGRLSDAIPFMQALVAAAPERLVWGSDWPNIGFHSGTQITDFQSLAHRELDAGEMLDTLAAAVPDVDARRAILVSNPGRLYDFGAPPLSVAALLKRIFNI